MDEAGSRGRAAELEERMARLEAQLSSQREEIATLGQELQKLRAESGRAGYVQGFREAAPPASRAFQRPQALRIVGTPGPMPSHPPGDGADQHFPQDESAADRAGAPQSSLPGFGAFGVAASDAAASPASESKPVAQRSVENRIGSQWFSRVGIVALLVGVALFLKLAIDNHWIHATPIGRTTAGLLVGAAIVLWSERFRRKGYDTFSYSLKAVGTGTLYLSLWASFQLYHLWPASVALIAMIGVTAWNAAMAWLQDSELLAAYALVGGFATPALLGSGGNHEVFLFSYVLAMDVAVLVLLAKKPWQRLLLGSFPGTVVYFVAWYARFFTANQAGVTGMFVVLLSAPFVAVALAGRQREGRSEGVVAPLASASFLALALYSVLQDSGRHGWLPWAAVALAGVYLLLMRVRRAGLAEAMHLALAIIFLTIAIPLKAEGRWITIGWQAEGVVLLWMASKLLGAEVQARVRTLMRGLGCVALGLGVADSLIFWWSEPGKQAFWNGRFWTEMAAVGALALAAWLARQAAKDEAGGLDEAVAPGLRRSRFSLVGPTWQGIALVYTFTAHVVAAIATAREIGAFWHHDTTRALDYREQLEPISIAAFLILYGACVVAWVVLRRKPGAPVETESTQLRRLAVVYQGIGLVAMLVTPTLESGGPVNVFWNLRLLLETAGAAALAWTAWLAWRAHSRGDTESGWMPLAAGSLVAFNLLALLAGVHEITTYFGVSAVGDAGLAEAFTISAWLMLYAAGLLAAGFWKRMAFVRWQGLGLLVFTIGKVFLYDVRSLGSIYRILSFFGLGVVLMTVSFAYQKDWLGLRETSAEPDEAAR